MGNMNGFNAAEHEPSRDFEPIPAGTYRAQITASEQRDIGEGGAKGWKFTLTWTIQTGPYENRLLWQDVLVGNNVAGEKGDKTRNIANSQMGDICGATGKLTPDDTSELHFIPCDIVVGFAKQQMNQQTNQPYPPRNEVKSVKAAGGAGQASRFAPPQNGNGRPAAGGGQAQQQPPRQAAQPSRGGWNRS